MTWRWLTCFSALAALALATAPIARAGDVAGTVELTNSNDVSTRRGHNYSGVVLWLEPIPRPNSLPVVPKRAEMAQRNKQFQPHVLAIAVGSTVDFPNFDPVHHNVFSNFSGQQFDVGLYPAGASRSVTFKYPGIVRVFCNIHSTMSAIIAVLASPWFTVTPPSGKFVIPNVPPGEYVLRIFHERALPENLQLLAPRITVPENGLVLPLISISETGYIPAPHVDKHGEPYPQPPRNSTYSGGGN
jgi:plastocyanin